MVERPFRWLRLSGLVGAPILLLIVAGVLVSLAFRPWHRSTSIEGLPHAPVRRVDMRVSLTASGRVESSKRTVIACEIENLQIRSKGQEMNVGGSSIILSLIPDGTFVKKGDVLCELDASAYEDLVLQQQLKVQEARALKLQSDLDLEVKQLAITEYKEGMAKQLDKDFKGRIALTEADLERSIDRLEWSQRMLAKGYASAAQLITDKIAVKRNRVNLDTLQGEYQLFQKFGVTSTMRSLEVDQETAEIIAVYHAARLRRFEERLKHYQHQVEVCTIRAPHDGFLIYYTNERDPNPRIEEGASVRQSQNMFYLPDLADMEVLATINETVVDRVRDGMSARVHFEALPNSVVEGHVIWVSQVPMWNTGSLSMEVKNYQGRVKLDSLPNGLRPGMSAEVEIVTGNHPDALVVPPEAIAYEGGREVCYVASQERLERRQVTVGSTSLGMVEVTDGLAEGEEVVLDPGGKHAAQIAGVEIPTETDTDSDDSWSSPANVE